VPDIECGFISHESPLDGECKQERKEAEGGEDDKDNDKEGRMV